MAPTTQLAAIMLTDIVGHGHLVDQNQALTNQIIAKNKEIQKPLIEKHRGRWLKDLTKGSLACLTIPWMQ